MSMGVSIPRPEYPRPQMVRNDWMNLNGEWEFEIDNGKSGKNRKLYEADKLKDKIIVPFCPESKLSGIEHRDFMSAVWYRRELTIPDAWLDKRVLLHFGAVDYETEVWVNGISAGKHRGGYTPFNFDITSLLKPESNSITVYAEDDLRSGRQPRGKQSDLFYSYGCLYTRTTGIWQTVWLECVAGTYISEYKLVPDPENSGVHINTSVKGETGACILTAEAFLRDKKVGSTAAAFSGRNAFVDVMLSDIQLWEPGNPNLYDLKLTLSDGTDIIDIVEGYFGLRTISLKDKAILINNKPVFQRLVLDQGFYPDGVYTAPSDEDLKKDIEISMGLGFNGARMHEKVFDPRYIYWADKYGYLVWGEHGNWGLDISTPASLAYFLPEWLEAVERDFNHPSVIGWCPFNETQGNQDAEVVRAVYRTTRMVDKTRPVIDTSGWNHVESDVFDIHDYVQDTEEFAAKFEPMKNGGEAYTEGQKYDGQPYFVSEYGGTWWSLDNKGDSSWGYGTKPANEEEFLKRYEGLTTVLLDNPSICAFCYTQLYDVEQEQNGLYTYDRKPKFEPELIRKVNSKKAAIEK